ncbi:MAG: UbiA prenyltransferase family protein, partial [bacterium]|nr:UbiA prenyltransferase family protein [bacterium]
MLVAFLRSLRPTHWIKNLCVLAPLLFGRQLTEPEAIVSALLAVACFCLLSGALYVVNDIADASSDRNHPSKRYRPIASGELPAGAGLAGAALIAAAAFALASVISRDFLLIAAMYCGLTLAYSLALKRIVIVDVMVIAAGFVLRVMGGAAAVAVEPSHWLIACAYLLALYLGVSKRRLELLRAPDNAIEQRAVLGEYTGAFTGQINLVLLGATCVCYLLYAVAPEPVARFGTG